jgi:LuxR family maltose regulon positive regulatory protein
METNPMPPALLNTKLYIPPLRPRRVARAGLLDLLDDGLSLGRRLTLISAPAGFGKTMLVVEWLQHLSAMPEGPHAFGWLSLDESDSDPQRFFTYLAACLQQIAPGCCQGFQEMLQTPGAPDPEELLTSLANAMASIPVRFIMVLDDYHLVSSAPVHQALNFLIEHAPPQMHLVIASRADPPLSLARLRARGQLTELRENDLRFTMEETTGFLNRVMGLALSESQVSMLDGRTEGWVAGLQLAGLAIKSLGDSAAGEAHPEMQVTAFIQSFSGSNRYILDYLIEEVLDRQPKAMQQFLLDTAILERLCGSLCDAITGTEGGQSTLEWLEQSHLFILPLDNERYWFRYHHLFQDLLQHRARQLHSQRLPSLHQRAAIWFEAHGLIGEAVSHSMSAGEPQRAVRLIEAHATQALASGGIFALKAWLETLPEEIRRAQPWLCIYQAWIFLLTGQLEAIRAWLPETEQPFAGGWDRDYTTEDQEQMQGHSAAIRAYARLFHGDVNGAVQAGRQALAQLPKSDLVVRSFVAFTLGGAYLYSDDLDNAIGAFEEASTEGKIGGNVHIVLPAQRILAYLQAEKGLLRQSAQTCQTAIQLATDERGRLSPVTANALGTLGNLHYEWNELEAAQRCLSQAIALDKSWGNPDSALSNLTHMARVLYALGQVEAGDQFLQQAENLLHSQHLTPGTASLLMHQQVINWSKQRNLAQIVRWIESHAPPIEGAVTYINRLEYLSLARALLALGRLDEAHSVLKRLGQWAREKNLVGRVIQVLVLQARLWQARGNHAQATTALDQALTLGEPGGYRRTFLDEGYPMGVLLGRVASQGIARDYARALLSELGMQGDESFSPQDTIPRQADLLIEPISERESEVLRLIGEGLTNQQIAERLVISLGTVKAHTSNIYRKLGVRNRTQALGRARELKLI